jgi:hypothetical protein
MWFMAVAAFYYQLRISVNAASIVERAAYEKHRKAMTHHVDFGKQLAAFFAAFPKLSAESRIEALQKMEDRLALVAATLTLDVSDFSLEPSPSPER